MDPETLDTPPTTKATQEAHLEALLSELKHIDDATYVPTAITCLEKGDKAGAIRALIPGTKACSPAATLALMKVVETEPMEKQLLVADVLRIFKHFPEALTYAGVIYENAKEFEQAFRLYQLASRTGHMGARISVARFQLNGSGTKPNPTQGFKTLREINQRYPKLDTLYREGICHYMGLGTPRNMQEALRLFQNVVLLETEGMRDQESIAMIDSHYRIGRIYASGPHLEDHKNLAFDHLLIAATSYHLEAQAFLGEFVTYEALQNNNLDDAKMGVEWLRVAAENESTHALSNLGAYYTTGIENPDGTVILPYDLSKAKECFLKCIEMAPNYPHAYYQLANLERKALLGMEKKTNAWPRLESVLRLPEQNLLHLAASYHLDRRDTLTVPANKEEVVLLSECKTGSLDVQGRSRYFAYLMSEHLPEKKTEKPKANKKKKKKGKKSNPKKTTKHQTLDRAKILREAADKYDFLGAIVVKLMEDLLAAQTKVQQEAVFTQTTDLLLTFEHNFSSYIRKPTSYTLLHELLGVMRILGIGTEKNEQDAQASFQFAHEKGLYSPVADICLGLTPEAHHLNPFHWTLTQRAVYQRLFSWLKSQDQSQNSTSADFQAFLAPFEALAFPDFTQPNTDPKPKKKRKRKKKKKTNGNVRDAASSSAEPESKPSEPAPPMAEALTPETDTASCASYRTIIKTTEAATPEPKEPANDISAPTAYAPTPFTPSLTTASGEIYIPEEERWENMVDSSDNEEQEMDFSQPLVFLT